MIRFKKGPPFQVSLISRPFWMLVACSLVNLTKWTVAEPIFQELYRRSGGDSSWFLPFDREAELQKLLKPLGLWRRRTKSLQKMAFVYRVTKPRKASDLIGVPGCGKYARDSWAIFIDGDYGVEPTDHILLKYLEEVLDAKHA